MAQWQTRPGIAAAALLLLAAAVRLPGLGQSFWYDEIISVLYFFRAPWRVIVTEMPLPNNHPLYSLLAKSSILALGEKEWAARLPAFLMGAMVPPALYLFARKRVGEWEAAVAGLLACLSAQLVWLAQDARGFSGMVLLTLAATHLLYELRERPSSGLAALYVLAAASSVYFHLYGGWVIAAHLCAGLTWALAGPGPRRRVPAIAAASGLALAFLLYLPMLPEALEFARTQGTINTGRAMDAAFIADTLASWTGGRGRPGLSLIVLAPGAAGFIIVALKRPGLAALVALPLAAAALTARVAGFFVFARFFTFALPGLYLFAAAGIVKAGEGGRARKSAAVLLALAACLSLLPSLLDYHRQGKQAIRPAVEYIQKNLPGRRTVAAGLIGDVIFYYEKDAVPVRANQPYGPAVFDNSAAIVSFPWSVAGPLQDELNRRCRLAREWPSAGAPELAVRVYECD